MPPTRRWVWDRVVTLRAIARARRVRFTLKALEEISDLGLGMEADDVCDVLAGLAPADFAHRVISDAGGEQLLVFKPLLLGVRMYIKLAVRTECVVISFHADPDPDEDSHAT